MSKQDRQGVRTPADVERKYNFGKAFSEVMGAARDAGAVAEDAQAVALKVLKLQDSMEVSIATLEGQYSNLEISTEGIRSEVAQQTGNIEDLNKQMTSVSQTAVGLSVQIKNIQDNGVDKVQTTTGYTFGDDGLKIEKSDDEISTVINHEGMRVKRISTNVLTANADGVEALNIKVHNYLTIGAHARFEDYTDEEGHSRTACFHIE